jgi:hypothetical protein
MADKSTRPMIIEHGPFGRIYQVTIAPIPSKQLFTKDQLLISEDIGIPPDELLILSILYLFGLTNTTGIGSYVCPRVISRDVYSGPICQRIALAYIYKRGLMIRRWVGYKILIAYLGLNTDSI